MPNSECEKILGIHFDRKLDFNTHVTKLCSKAGQKLHALARISNFMSTKQKQLIMNAFISSQFGYCPLIWMSHSRALNTRISRIHEHALRIVYDDHSSSFDTLLDKSGQVKIHHRNLRILAVEIYKTLNNLSNNLMLDIFRVKYSDYNLCGGNNNFICENIKTVNYGSETISFLGPKIWELIPDDIRNSESLNIFKKNINQWIPASCPCKLCKVYIENLGYI